jgi:hypothetical protein
MNRHFNWFIPTEILLAGHDPAGAAPTTPVEAAGSEFDNKELMR